MTLSMTLNSLLDNFKKRKGKVWKEFLLDEKNEVFLTSIPTPKENMKNEEKNMTSKFNNIKISHHFPRESSFNNGNEEAFKINEEHYPMNPLENAITSLTLKIPIRKIYKELLSLFNENVSKFPNKERDKILIANPHEDIYIRFHFHHVKKEKILTFKIDDWITLKLEHGKTNIYVKDKKFHQCTYLLMNIKNQEEQVNINSIDEAAQKLDRSLEGRQGVIDPHTEFWGHCSNIHAWIENDYDTRILHNNISFPLLKELAINKVPRARMRYIEEITCRLEEDPTNRMSSYLLTKKFFDFLMSEEITHVFETLREKHLYTPLKNILKQITSPSNCDDNTFYKSISHDLLKTFIRTLFIECNSDLLEIMENGHVTPLLYRFNFEEMEIKSFIFNVNETLKMEVDTCKETQLKRILDELLKSIGIYHQPHQDEFMKDLMEEFKDIPDTPLKRVFLDAQRKFRKDTKNMNQWY